MTFTDRQLVLRRYQSARLWLKARHTRSLHITGASCIVNTAIGLGKLIMGIFSLSLFTCVSALYTFGMVIARICILFGFAKAKTRRQQYSYYALAGAILLGSSILYILYSVRLFINPEPTAFHMYVGIGIATFTFFELAVNIRGVLLERHNHAPLIHAVKMISLASSLICLALTQTAILSFADTQGPAVQSQANGLMGIIMGSAASIIGLLMVSRRWRFEHAQARKNFSKTKNGSLL